MFYINISFQFTWSVSWCIWLISHKNNILECSSSLWYLEEEIEAGAAALRFWGPGQLLNCCAPCSDCGQSHLQPEFRWETVYNDTSCGKQLNVFLDLWLHFNHFISNIWVLGLQTQCTHWVFSISYFTLHELPVTVKLYLQIHFNGKLMQFYTMPYKEG